MPNSSPFLPRTALTGILRTLLSGCNERGDGCIGTTRRTHSRFIERATGAVSLDVLTRPGGRAVDSGLHGRRQWRRSGGHKGVPRGAGSVCAVHFQGDGVQAIRSTNGLGDSLTTHPIVNFSFFGRFTVKLGLSLWLSAYNAVVVVVTLGGLGGGIFTAPGDAEGYTLPTKSA